MDALNPLANFARRVTFAAAGVIQHNRGRTTTIPKLGMGLQTFGNRISSFPSYFRNICCVVKPEHILVSDDWDAYDEITAPNSVNTLLKHHAFLQRFSSPRDFEYASGSGRRNSVTSATQNRPQTPQEPI